MTEPLLRALNRMRALILDPEVLVKAVASGRQKGEAAPPWRRVELRYVAQRIRPSLLKRYQGKDDRPSRFRQLAIETALKYA